MKAQQVFGAALSCAMLLAGCGARSTVTERSAIEVLRERAAAHPDDAALQRELVLGEHFLPDGDLDRARSGFSRILEASPDDALMLSLRADDHFTHGEYRAGNEDALHAIEAATNSSDPLGIAMGRLEIWQTIARLDKPSSRDRFEALFRRLLADPKHLDDAETRFTLQKIIGDIEQLNGKFAEAKATYAAAGCPDTWKVAGPFGPRELLGFDDVVPAQGSGAMLPEYDLGPGRGIRKTRELDAQNCSLAVGGGPVADGGTTIAETKIRVAEAGHYVVRLESPNAIELWVDAQRVIRRDSRVGPAPRIFYQAIDLTAAEHEIKVKISSRHPSPIFSFAVLKATGADDRSTKPFATPGAPVEVYVTALNQLWRGDIVGARETIRTLGDGANQSATVLKLLGTIAPIDPYLPQSVSRDEARRYLRAIVRRDPNNADAVVGLARLDAADGQVVEAMATLRRAVQTWPEAYAARIDLAHILRSKGWGAEADRLLAQAHIDFPEICSVARELLDSARMRQRKADVDVALPLVMKCDNRSYAQYEQWVAERDWQKAAHELQRLAVLQPRQHRNAVLANELEIVRASGAPEQGIQEILNSLQAEAPRDPAVRLAMADVQAAHGNESGARQILDQAYTSDPAAMANLYWVRRAIGAADDLAPYRKNGAEIVRAFEASGHHYDAPEVLVFDYSATRVYPDGSSIQLTHQIYKAQSEEAVNRLGEFSPPDGARMLTLHTIKADGRRMEPDQIDGKDSISLPSVAVGDYVEYEYVQSEEPSNGFPGGYLSDRFFFKSFETPFDQSQEIFILPSSMAFTVDPRGAAPVKDERVEGDLRVISFGVHQSESLVPEPGSVMPREYLPSVRIATNASWDTLIDGMRDVLIDKSPIDPAATRLVAEILHHDATLSNTEKAKRLYAWALLNVESNNDFFGVAPVMLAARTGHRDRVLHYLYNVAGIPADLVAVRSFSADATPSEIADAETYSTALIRAHLDGTDVWLSALSRGAPFGYVPELLREQEGIVLAAQREHVRVHVPATGANHDSHTVNIDIQTNPNGRARMDVTETYTGQGAITWRTQLESIAAAELNRRFEEAYVARLVPGAVLATLAIDGREDPESALVLRYSFDVESLGRRTINGLAIPMPFPTQIEASLASRAERTTTELVASALRLDLTISVHAADAALPAPAAPLTLEAAHGAHYSLTQSRAPGVLTVERHVEIPLMRITPAEYPAFSQFARRADSAEGAEITLRSTP